MNTWSEHQCELLHSEAKRWPIGTRVRNAHYTGTVVSADRYDTPSNRYLRVDGCFLSRVGSKVMVLVAIEWDNEAGYVGNQYPANIWVIK